MSEHPTPRDGTPAVGTPPERMLLLELAEDLFNAYNYAGQNPWKTFDGRDVPRWPRLDAQVRGKWLAVALRAVERL